VLSLLAQEASAERLLEQPALASETEKVALLTATRLGPYEVLGLVGTGGMGEVYRARDERLGREVAIKVLPAESSADPDRLRRFEQEAKAAGALNHPNLVAVFDTGHHEGAPYVVFELLEGVTLRQRLGSGPLPGRRAVDYAVQIAQGLAAAHEKGIIHRDLKPENLFVTKDGRVKILDFGLAKLRPALDPHAPREQGATVSTATGGGVVLGTVGYMSPEQVRGDPADHRSDIFSFGAVLYEMLSGTRPFCGETSAEVMTAILREDPPEVANADAPPGLERLVRRCLEKGPEERFQSARDLAFALETGRETGPTKPTVLSRRGHLAAMARRPLLVAVAVAGLFAASLLVSRWLRPPPTPQITGSTQLTFIGTVMAADLGRPLRHPHGWGQDLLHGWRGWPGAGVRVDRGRRCGPRSRAREEQPLARSLARARTAPGQRLALDCADGRGTVVRADKRRRRPEAGGPDRSGRRLVARWPLAGLRPGRGAVPGQK
jgi:hypothetical protein